ncbi:MAG: substrate-binding domain-containing protein [Christensenellales bacterium]
MKKLLLILVSLVLMFAIGSASAAKVGIVMPTNALQRWNQDGGHMKSLMEDLGHEVDLQYSNNDVALQISQLENMVLGGCEVLVIASIDGSSLGNLLAHAKSEGIAVIAYDRMLTNTPDVDYLATFDNYKVGAIQAKFIEDRLDLANTDKVYNFELFAGSPDDATARFFHAGAWDILEPYYEAGKFVVKSDQTSFEAIATLYYATDNAQARMDNLLTQYADGTPLHCVLSPNDSIALGVANSLEAAGFTQETWPIITGQDCDIPNVKNIIAGKQAMSVFKDTRTLAAQVVDMVTAILEGKEVPVNDTTSYHNGVKYIPTNLSDPVFADKDNYRELLIDSGYYTEEQLKVD